jgi:nifR3 family TIM-barrel protein
MSTLFGNLKRPILALAPMAGYTESPFRTLVKEIEPSTLLISELLSARAFQYADPKTRRMAFFSPAERPFGIQLFGSNTESFIAAARVVEELEADFIDLNFGCPSPKVINSGNGSALLRDPCASAKMIEQLVQSTKLPVTVKMRLGFYDDTMFQQTCVDFQNAGIQMLAVHGRTTQQKFSGTADWEPIYRVKEKLTIPVLGNGDITSAEIAVERIKNLDGIMIGRAAVKNPWIFTQCRAAFEEKKIPSIPPLKEQLRFFEKQAKLAIEQKGERFALMELRKHLAQFVRGVDGAAQFRDRLIRVETIGELKEIFDEIRATVHTANDV